MNQTIKGSLSKKLFGTNSVRWIDFHQDVVCSYNRTVHSATNKSPFVLFFGHPGFNMPTNGGDFVENSDNNRLALVENLNINNNEDEESTEYEKWDFNNTVVLNDESSADIALRNEVMEHFQKYKERVIRNVDSNLVSRSIEIGDKVLIKKDFDMNPKTQKASF